LLDEFDVANPAQPAFKVASNSTKNNGVRAKFPQGKSETVWLSVELFPPVFPRLFGAGGTRGPGAEHTDENLEVSAASLQGMPGFTMAVYPRWVSRALSRLACMRQRLKHCCFRFCRQANDSCVRPSARKPSSRVLQWVRPQLANLSHCPASPPYTRMCMLGDLLRLAQSRGPNLDLGLHRAFPGAQHWLLKVDVGSLIPAKARIGAKCPRFRFLVPEC